MAPETGIKLPSIEPRMKFFIPHVPEADYAQTYDGIIKSVKEQMRIPVAPRKIYRLEYTQGKKQFKAEVGRPDPQQGRYEIFAILEAKPYVVFTRLSDGGPGLTILVSSDDVTGVIDFEE
jgi:hypothetical protein